jgi:hypothetical protein
VPARPEPTEPERDPPDRPGRELAGASSGDRAGWPPTGPSAPPSLVRAAAVVVCAQGALAAAFAVLLAIASSIGSAERAQKLTGVLAEAGFFLVLAAAVLAVGVALLRGHRWARTPALVLQVVLLGVAWYTLGPSGRPEYGVPIGLVSLATAAALLGPKARAWAYDD